MCLDFDLNGNAANDPNKFYYRDQPGQSKQVFLKKIEVVSHLPKETEISDGM